MQTSKGERKHRDILLCIYFGKRYDHHIDAIVLIAISRGRRYKERVFSFFSSLTFGHKLSRHFCSFNLALGSQYDNYVAQTVSSIILLLFFCQIKKERSQKIYHDLFTKSLLILSEKSHIQCVKFKSFNA